MFLALFESKDFERFKGRLLDAYPNGFTDEEPEDSHKIIEWVYAHCNQRRLAELDIPPEAIHRWVNVAYMVSRTGVLSWFFNRIVSESPYMIRSHIFTFRCSA